jgi:hypothetical protein
MKPRKYLMPVKLKYGMALVALICLAPSLTARTASAITVEVAKKCGASTDKAYPLRVPGNPAAGRARGTSQEIRDYFNKCVARGGEMEEQAPEQRDNKNAQAPNQGDDKEQAPDQK